MMTTYTRTQIEALVEALHAEMIDGEGDDARSAMDAILATGTPASEEYAERIGVDYICALADGTVAAWGGDIVLTPGVIGRELVFVSPADQVA